MSNGSAIFLSPKCYFMEDRLTGERKKALKGIHCQTLLQYDDFIDVLYNNSTVMRNQTRLRRNLKNYTVQLQREKKRALNSVYYKFKISCLKQKAGTDVPASLFMLVCIIKF